MVHATWRRQMPIRGVVCCGVDVPHQAQQQSLVGRAALKAQEVLRSAATTAAALLRHMRLLRCHPPRLQAWLS